MFAARLSLQHDERVDVCTYDNRQLVLKCTKHFNGEPALDLLPRMRHMLRIHPVRRENVGGGGLLFFKQGLVVVPDETESDGLVRRVVVMNLTEKTIRVCNNGALGGDAPALDAPALDAPALDAPALHAPALHAPALDAPALDDARSDADAGTEAAGRSPRKGSCQPRDPQDLAAVVESGAVLSSLLTRPPLRSA